MKLILFLLTVIFCSYPVPLLAQDKAYDYLIQGAQVFDGVGDRGVMTDVAISGDVIAAMGQLEAKDAKFLVDGALLVMTPGLIDVHTHSDFNPIVYPNLTNKLFQGVTTEVVGQCGMSAAPVYSPHTMHIYDIWGREGVVLPEELPWSNFRDYQRELAFKGLTTNFVGFVGHGNLRSSVLGLEPREASREERDAMKQLLEKSMKEGAFGISFGLVYLPGVFANSDEITELCQTAAQYKGVCAFHIRGEGSQLIEALEEVIAIGKAADATIQISHLKAAGENNWEKIEEAFRLIERALSDGLRIRADAYPYTAGFAELAAVLPEALYERQDRLEYVKNPENRKAILDQILTEVHRDWNQVMIANADQKDSQKVEGKTIQKIADETGETPEEVFLDLLIDSSFRVSAFFFSQSEDVVQRVLAQPYVFVGSDSIADGRKGTHPRVYGTFPKILKQHHPEKSEIKFSEALRKMTALPADHFRIPKRGRIRPGHYADLVLWDMEKLRDRATYETPNRLATGVEWVFVNGEPVIEEGSYNGLKKGRILEFLPG